MDDVLHVRVRGQLLVLALGYAQILEEIVRDDGLARIVRMAVLELERGVFAGDRGLPVTQEGVFVRHHGGIVAGGVAGVANVVAGFG